MNIEEHPLYKRIYELCLEIEKFPASEHQTKCCVLASALDQEAAHMVQALQEIKATVLNMMPETTQCDLARIIRLCLNAGIHQKMDELNTLIGTRGKQPIICRL